MAVVVNMNGKHAYSARALLPDGSVFVFSEKEETPQGMHQGVLKNESLADTTSDASLESIFPDTEKVNSYSVDDAAYMEDVERGDMSYSVDDIIYDGLISKPDIRLTDIYDTIKTEDRANAFEAAGDKTNAARERRRARELGREYREFSEHVGLSVKASRTQTLKSHGESFALEKPEKMGYNSGAKSGAYNNKNDPDGSKRDTHANMYYEELRNSKKQNIVSSIARNSGVNESTVSNVYDHLLINEYDLGGETRRFDTDYDIAESLQRLITGKNIQEHDIVLLRHEALEYILMNEDGLSYVEAHSMANESFNYAEALKKFLKGSGE